MQNVMQIHCSTQSVILKCNGHTVHMLTQQHLPPPVTSTVKLSLFTHAHSNPLSLAARLHRYNTNHSHYINNIWTSSGQTSYNKNNNRRENDSCSWGVYILLSEITQTKIKNSSDYE